MTPKEKAKQLIIIIGNETSPQYDLLNKKLALLCVDEIIKANPTEYILSGTSGPDANLTAYYKYENNESYWQEVKQELQNI